jgi:MarR family transcriptional regulator, lower aerobic nicotinate degradation pathway regulator
VAQRDPGTFTRLQELPTWLVNRAYARSHRLVTEGFAAAGTRGYHYRLLAALDEFGPASQAALGRRTGVDRSDVAAAVSDLLGRGFVDRSTDADDRRRNVVALTAVGRRQLRKLDQVLDGIQEEFVAPLSAAERRQLVRLLGRLVDPSEWH